MNYLTVNGVREKIPPFPHHKDFIYRVHRFFTVKSVVSFLTIDGVFSVPNKIVQNWKHSCSIPRLLLVDPTSACNLKCTGCWAGDYDKTHSLSFEKLDEVFTEAEKLGVLQIIMSGGEPLLRKDDILELARRHPGLSMAAFTNGTLIDEPFAVEMSRLGNLNVFLSIEGFKEETDFRRGEGVYDKVIAAMDILKRHDIGFGFSACYHSGNYDVIASDRFLNFMQEKGAWFGWLFNYIPIGKDADLSLCCSAEQRAYVLKKIEKYSREKSFTLIDFANNGHKAFGCVAAGNDFAHINANGDLEPCAFCHYSDTNIHDKTLAEALRSPFFSKFRSAKPFSKNMLRPCPMVDVPEAFADLASDPSVHSTHYRDPESPMELAAKTKPLARNWQPVADEIFKDMPEKEKQRFGILNHLLKAGNVLMRKTR
jgi:MoaA/NifB/PqqE/SkfB family radical SAM enzyme